MLKQVASGAILIVVCMSSAFGKLVPQYNAPSTLFSGVGAAYAVATGDLDRDGDQDIVLPIWDRGQVVWYESNGARPPQFTLHVLVSTPNAHDVLVSDLSGDGWPDIVSLSGDRVYFFRNLRTSPATFELVTLDSGGIGAWNAHIVDVDGDGHLDIVAALSSNRTVAWYRNNGNPPQTTFTRRVITNQAQVPIYVRGADVDRDGRNDVIVSSSTDKKLAWWKNNGDGSFSERVISTEGWSIEIGDLDKDGWIDFTAIGGGTNSVSWYRNLGASGTVSFFEYPLYNYAGPQSMWLLDYDYDRDLDVLLASSTAHNVIWFENSSLIFDAHIIPMGTKYTWNASTFDADVDGDLDILELTTDAVMWMENTSGVPEPVNAVRDWAAYQ